MLNQTDNYHYFTKKENILICDDRNAQNSLALLSPNACI